MTLLANPSSRLACLRVLDLSADATDVMLDALADDTERHARRRPGFSGGRWLSRTPDSAGASRTRLLEYTLWASRGDLDAFAAGTAPLPAEVEQVVDQRSTRTYRLEAIITGADTGPMTMEPGDPRVAIVVMMEPAAGQQAEVSEFNQRETREFFADHAGFVGAAFHLADHDDGVVEYIQWESTAAYRAAAADPRFMPHLETLARLCRSEVATYDVGRAIDATTPSS